MFWVFLVVAGLLCLRVLGVIWFFVGFVIWLPVSVVLARFMVWCIVLI